MTSGDDTVPERDGTAVLDTSAAGGLAVRGGALRVVGYAVGVAATVASAALLFRHLGVVDGGRYVLVLSLVTLAGGVTDAGLSSLGVREIVLRDGQERASFVRHLIGLRIVFSVLGIGLACAYAAVAGYGGTLILGTALAGLGVLVQNLQSTLATGLMAELRLGWVTAVDLLRQLVTVLGIVVLVELGAELLPFLALVPVAGAVALAMTAVLVRRSIPFAPAYARREWWTLIVETLPFALAVAVGAIYFRLAILLVDLVSNATQTGYFGVSFRIVEVVVAVPQLVVGAGFPIFARAARDDAQRLRYGLQRMLEACVLLGAAVAVGLGVGAPVAIEVVAGSGFDDAIPVLRLHAIAMMFAFASAVFGYALLSLHRHRAVLVMNAAALAAIAVLVPVLARSSGAEGAAAATAVAELVLASAGWLLLARAGGVQLGLGKAPRVALAAALALLPALVLPALPATVAGLIVLGAAALALGAVPEEAVVEARGVLRRLRRA